MNNKKNIKKLIKSVSIDNVIYSLYEDALKITYNDFFFVFLFKNYDDFSDLFLDVLKTILLFKTDNFSESF